MQQLTWNSNVVTQSKSNINPIEMTVAVVPILIASKFVLSSPTDFRLELVVQTKIKQVYKNELNYKW